MQSTLSPDERIAKTKAEYGNVAKSPYFRDTLGVTVPVREDYNRGPDGVYGLYSRNSFRTGQPEILVNSGQPLEQDNADKPPASVFSARNVLTHEGAHSLDVPGSFPSYRAVNRPMFLALSPTKLVRSDANNMWSDGFDLDKNLKFEKNKGLLRFVKKGKFSPLSGVERDAVKALNPYGMLGGPRAGASTQTNPREAFAQAFTNAAGFLSETGSDTTDYREKLGRYEGNTPGTGAIVRDLFMANPIYKNHPLKGRIK
jgi:hypothetical protein